MIRIVVILAIGLVLALTIVIAAKALGLTAGRLYELGLVDRVCSSEKTGDLLKEIAGEIRKLKQLPVEDLVDKRYEKFRKVGY
jgi:acetyl-CoA carboxylase carboxyl transferase subunit alpha